MAYTLDVTLTRRTVLGAGSLAQLGALAAEHGAHALVAIGGGSVKRSGALGRALSSLDDAGIKHTLFEGIEPDPSVETADRGVLACREAGCDVVIGLGGGSVMDCAKAIAILAAHEGPAADYQFARREIERPGLPFVAVSTTSGTGSEANKVAVLTNKREEVKKAIIHPLMVPRVAVLDPELTLSLPPFETAYTGIDALSHAAEAYVSLNANPLTEGWALRALELVGRSLPVAVGNGADLDARADMAMANYLAGAALNSGVGCAHILAHPLGASFGLPHGVAIAAVLPQVFEANASVAPERYARIHNALRPGQPCYDVEEAASQAGDALRELLDRIAFRPRLGEHGVDPEGFDLLLTGVEKSMSHVKTNPRPATTELLTSILAASL